MKCNDALELITAQLDGELSEADRIKLEEHLVSCESCTVAFEELKAINLTMGETPMLALPIGFEEELHLKLIKAKNEMQQKEKVGLWDKIKQTILNKSFYAGAATVMAMGLIVFVASNSLPNAMSAKEMAVTSESYDEADFAGVQNKAMPPTVTFTSEDATADYAGVESVNASPKGAEPYLETANNNAYRQERLIIKNAYLNLDVESFDEVFNTIANSVEALGGYLESSNSWIVNTVNNREFKHGEITLKIPANDYEGALENIKSYGRVVQERLDADDVTKAYRDTASQIENLKITEARLQELLKQAKEVDDLLMIENELTRIRYQINSFSDQLQNWEYLVDYSTVTIELNEVEALDPKIKPIDETLWDKAKTGFINTINTIKHQLERFFIWVVAKSPLLVGIAIIAIVAYQIIKRKRRK